VEIKKRREVASVGFGAAGAGDDEARGGERGGFQRRGAAGEHALEDRGDAREALGEEGVAEWVGWGGRRAHSEWGKPRELRERSTLNAELLRLKWLAGGGTANIERPTPNIQWKAAPAARAGRVNSEADIDLGRAWALDVRR
jgi:hypothetical protein